MFGLPSWVFAIIGVVGGLFVLIIAVAGYFFFFKKKKQYPFLLYSRNMRDRRVVYGSLKIDPDNKEDKKFFFAGMTSTLPLKEPTCFQDGKAYREIIQNKDGGYSYIEECRLDEDKYMSLSLSPDEKSLALHRIKENEDRNQNPMSKHQAVMLITGFVLIIILVIGIIYATIAYVGASKNLVKLAEETKKITNTIASSNNVMKDITAQQTAIIAALANNVNVTRVIT